MTIGGGVRIVLQHADELWGRGHKVNVVYPQVPGHIMELAHRESFISLFRKAIQSFQVSSKTNWGTKAEIIKIPTTLGKARTIWAKFIPDADVIISPSWRMVEDLRALPDSKGKPIHFVQDYEIWELWNSDENWQQASEQAESPQDICIEMASISPSSSKLKAKKNKVDRALSTPVPKFVVSPWLAELLNKHFNSKNISIVPNGVDTTVFYPDRHPKSIPIEHDRITILAPSRSAPYKLTNFSIDAFKRLRSKGVDFQPIMYGWEGDEIPDWIHSVGRVSDAELRRLYSYADIFVNPSRAEGWGLPSMEALACETAVVSTETGWVRDYGPEDVVIKVPPNDKEEFINSIEKLIKDGEKQTTMARKGKEFINRRFTKKKSADTFEESLIGLQNT